MNRGNLYLSFTLLLLTITIAAAASAVDNCTYTNTTIPTNTTAPTNSTLIPINSTLIPTLIPTAKCEPSNASPLLSDARTVSTWLLSQPSDSCRGTARCTTLGCNGTACISRCASSETYHARSLLRYTCMQLADWARQVVEKPECWTGDRMRVGGQMRVREDGVGGDWTEVNVYARPAVTP